MKTFDIVCGGAASAFPATGGNDVRMDVQGDARNVNLKIEDISRAMVSNIPDVLMDLLEVAAYVYCADQRCSRGSSQLTDYGRDWRRNMQFTIPVRNPGLWESSGVKEALCDMLSFLADETYSFSFVKADRPLAEKTLYFSNLIEGTFVPDEVALFSGGIDSFAGAVEDMIVNNKQMALVGHYSASKVVNAQAELIKGLKQGGLENKLFYFPVAINNSGINAKEFTQRTRSFLFASLGLVISRMFEKDHFTFYENGVISLNIPIAKDVLGARATRTTHPKVLRGFERFFTELLDRTIEIKSPLQWFTKKEVVAKIDQCGFSHLLSTSASCTRPHKWKRGQRHCGVCSQCIDRRFAVLAAGLEKHEAPENYMVDLLTGAREKDADLRMAVAYVNCFQAIAATPKNRFLIDFPEITSALTNFPDMTSDQAKDKIFDMCQRHATDVLSVIADGVRQHTDELVRGELPQSSLLSLCFSRTKIETSPPSGYNQEVKDFMDKLKPLVCEFAVDTDAGRIFFKGGYYLDGANFNLANVLLENHRIGKKAGTDIAYIPASDLAVKLGISEQSMRQQVTRLRKEVEERLAVDLGVVLGTDDFIENKERAGYRLSPKLREVSKGDL